MSVAIETFALLTWPVIRCDTATGGIVYVANRDTRLCPRLLRYILHNSEIFEHIERLDLVLLPAGTISTARRLSVRTIWGDAPGERRAFAMVVDGRLPLYIDRLANPRSFDLLADMLDGRSIHADKSLRVFDLAARF